MIPGKDKLAGILEATVEDARFALQLAQSAAPNDHRLLHETAPDLARSFANLAYRLRHLGSEQSPIVNRKS